MTHLLRIRAAGKQAGLGAVPLVRGAPDGGAGRQPHAPGALAEGRLLPQGAPSLTFRLAGRIRLAGRPESEAWDTHTNLVSLLHIQSCEASTHRAFLLHCWIFTALSF